MSIVYAFSNSNNWEYVGQQTLNSPVSTVNDVSSIERIPDTGFFTALESPIIAVSVNAANEKASWNYAGHVFQRIITGITVGGNFDSYIDSQPIFFKKVNVIFFRQLNSSYALTFRPPRWVTSITYSVFKYVGPIEDLTQIKLDQILQELQAS
jgi:hypothetical protein